MSRGKYFELLDIPLLADPDVLMLQALPTAAKLKERAATKSFMSYGQIWSRFNNIVQGIASDEFILAAFSAYRDDWKNKAIQAAYWLLREHFGGRGKWYRAPNVPTYVLGCWFKSSIKGFWAYDGRVYAVLINCRKSQALSWNDVRFLARGIYELHCIDDPNNPIPLIVDLGLHPEDEKRKPRVYEVPVADAVSLEAFESSLREFMVASNLAGISLPPPPDGPVVDLFRRP